MTYTEDHPPYREIAVHGRLRLIEPDLSHADASLVWVRAPDVLRYMGADFSNPSLQGERKRLRDILGNRDEYSWMIEYDGVVIGNVCISAIAETTRRFGVKAGNLTVLIGEKAYWGKGIGSSACRAVLDWAFSEAAFEFVAARALECNDASIQTLRVLGFIETDAGPNHVFADGSRAAWRNFRREKGA